MIVGIGVDIVDVARVEKSIKRYGNSYLERVYTPREIEYCSDGANKWQRYAARMAAKEAAMKALGTGWGSGVEWLNFEVQHEALGRPALALTGAAADIARERGISRVWISLAHISSYAIAEVVFECDNHENR
jgi:holo-[acyl-carrier protein] synthase